MESDVEFDAEAISRPSTPVPFWLRTDEDVPGAFYLRKLKVCALVLKRNVDIVYMIES